MPWRRRPRTLIFSYLRKRLGFVLGLRLGSDRYRTGHLVPGQVPDPAGPASVPTCTGPIWVRTRRCTGWPTSSIIRRTIALRPSCSTISSSTRLPAESMTRAASDAHRAVLELDCLPAAGADVAGRAAR